MRCLAVALVGSAGGCRASPPAPPDAGAPLAASAVVAAGAPEAAAPSASAAAASAAHAPPGDGCKLRRGPLRLALKGPALLWSWAEQRGELQVVFNRDGAMERVAPAFPTLVGAASGKGGAAIAPPSSTGVAIAPPSGGDDGERASWPACTVADTLAFCMDLSGAIRRSPLSGGPSSQVGFGRRGSAIGAIALPGGHTLVAFLADRKTSEGVVTQAFAVLDDKPAVPLSEEGSGATFVALAPWKQGALAMYIDARAALTPVHARTVELAGEQLALGQDAVIFVGEGSDARQNGAIGVGRDGPAFVLLPAAKGASEFGMAVVRLDGAPKDDMPAVWSLYPNGLSPAPLAATRGSTPIRVARVRPEARAPGSRQVIELGALAEDGQFQPQCEAASGASFKHVAIETDRDGSTWIAYTNAAGTWLEQRSFGR